jgi:hypothetical protein
MTKQRRADLHKLQAMCRRELESTPWSRGAFLRDRIVEGARPAQLKAGAKLLVARLVKLRESRSR